jgi:predicted nucleotidyltransferase
MLDVSRENLLRSLSHTLAYADVFEYPLTAGEVCRYLTGMKASSEEVTRALANTALFARVGTYYTLRGRERIVETRERRTGIAARLWPQAARYGRMIARLPFVRMVAVTGSLAMSNADAGQDVDFMIVTEPTRLWTCRALCLLIARLARLAGVKLCPNYLVTTNALELPERSLYVAHELAQMIPLSGMAVYWEMRRLNNWTNDYLPNATSAPVLPQGIRPAREGAAIQRALEFFLRSPIVTAFEKWEMDRKILRLTREQSSSFESYFSEDVCKGHIDRHGETVVTALAVRLQQAIEVTTTTTP